jgi:hypothetical protein
MNTGRALGSARCWRRSGGKGQQRTADFADYISTKIPAEFWTELKAQKLIEQNAPVPA